MHVMDQWTRPGPNGRRVQTDRYGHGKRWLARWAEPSGRERSRAFGNQKEAEAFIARVRLEGSEFVDPRGGQATFGAYAERWYATKAALAPSTLAWYRGLLDEHVLPKWKDRPVGRVRTAELKEWLAGRQAGGLSASRVRSLHVVLAGVLDLAIEDRALTVNAARGVKRPKLPGKRRKPLTAAELARLIDALEERGERGGPGCGERAVCFALVLAFSGLRWGEAARLDIADLHGRVLHTDRAIATVGGRQVEGETKGHRHRDVPLPLSVVERLTDLAQDRLPSAPLLPAARGGRWNHGVWMRIWRDAVAAAGLTGRVPHELRHTAVSLAIAAGADVKVLQEMAGHQSATLTLDQYGDLMASRAVEIADALEADVPRRKPKLRAV